MVAVRLSRGWSRLLLTAVFCFAAMSICSVPKFVTADEPSEEEAEQIKAAERFLTVLEKSPRRGTALDRVYGHHVEFGTLDKFIASLKEKTTADPKDGTSWMLLGLIEAQRGQDGNAVDAFKQAEETRSTDPLTSYYLAQSLLRIGQNEEAIAAFERSIDRKPQRNDLLEIFQQLGRVHQRAQRTEEALKVWTRLESLFPDDPRVLEQIAVTLAEEGDSAQALTRYERLAKLVKDDYRRTMCLIEVAELKIKSSKKDDGIADLEKVMAQLDPDSWIYKDVRRRTQPQRLGERGRARAVEPVGPDLLQQQDIAAPDLGVRAQGGDERPGPGAVLDVERRDPQRARHRRHGRRRGELDRKRPGRIAGEAPRSRGPERDHRPDRIGHAGAPGSWSRPGGGGPRRRRTARAARGISAPWPPSR